eukprot:scaffold776_cov347-Pavlova_lutheri.AAC.100
MDAPRPEGRKETESNRQERGWRAPASAPEALAALRGETSAFFSTNTCSLDETTTSGISRTVRRGSSVRERTKKKGNEKRLEIRGKKSLTDEIDASSCRR